MSDLRRRDIRLLGCDDTTVITDLFTTDEVAFLERIAAVITAASGGSCQPTMEVREHIHGDIASGWCDECPPEDEF